MTKLTLQEKLHQAHRDHILEAAIEVIAERGFQRTTIKQIAKQAGIADGTLYNYFDNKAAIMTAIVSRATAGERRGLDFAQAEQVDFGAFARHYIPQRFQEVEAELATLKIIVSETLNDADLRKQVNDSIYAPMFQVAEQYIGHLISTGQLAEGDPATIARMLASPVFGLLMLRLLGDEHVTDNWAMYGNALAEMAVQFMESNEVDHDN